jgi:hypothetical protein
MNSSSKDILTTQAKEKQDLVKQQTILRKTIANAGKKEKKEIKTRIESMETDLKRMHASQILEFDLGALSLKEKVKEEQVSSKESEIVEESGPSNSIMGRQTVKEPSRQQKRKDRKKEEERESRKVAEEEAALMPDLKAQEQEAIDALIGPLNMSIKQVCVKY